MVKETLLKKKKFLDHIYIGNLYSLECKPIVYLRLWSACGNYGNILMQHICVYNQWCKWIKKLYKLYSLFIIIIFFFNYYFRTDLATFGNSGVWHFEFIDTILKNGNYKPYNLQIIQIKTLVVRRSCNMISLKFDMHEEALCLFHRQLYFFTQINGKLWWPHQIFRHEFRCSLVFELWRRYVFI